MYIKAKSNWGKYANFILVDILGLELAFFCAYLLRFGYRFPETISAYEGFALMLPVIHIFIVFCTEEYINFFLRGFLKEFKAVIKYLFILMGILLFYMFITKQSDDYSRIMIVIFLELSCVFLYMGRILLKQYLLHSYSQGEHRSVMLVITDKDLLESTMDKLQVLKYKKYIISGVVVMDEDMTNAWVQDTPIVANRETALEYIKINTVDEVFIHVARKDEKLDQLMRAISQMGITMHISIDWGAAELPNWSVQEMGGATVITSSVKVATLRQLFFKRTIDICGALVGLMLMLMAGVIFAPVIYLQSPGPILFSQERIGRNGRRFRIYKFRTMYLDAEARKKELMSQNKMQGLMFKIDNDPRIIPIGGFLRKSSIDELPQFINILKGEMSLVGTRPPTVDEYEKYELHHKKRLATKPGLTGMWQVSGRSDITNFEEVVALDTEYIKNWTLGLDLKIIFRTVGVVVHRVGSV